MIEFGGRFDSDAEVQRQARAGLEVVDRAFQPAAERTESEGFGDGFHFDRARFALRGSLSAVFVRIVRCWTFGIGA